MKNLVLICFFFLQWINSSAFNPDSVYHKKPTDFGLAFTETQILTSDSFSINIWIYEPENSDSTTPTIIMVGSDGGNMGALITHAYYLRHYGYRVISFDYRGFGHSTKFTYDPLIYYYPEIEKDFIAVSQFASKTYEGSINVLAFSMGTLVTLNCLAKDSTICNKIIFDGLVSNPQMVVKRVKKIKKKKGVKTSKFNNSIFYTPNIPILILAGSKDKLTTVSDAVQFQNANPNSMLLIFNGGHLQGLPALQTTYFSFISSFLN